MKNKGQKKQKTFQKAFTIIETLVAISILMVALAGPISIAERSLRASEIAKSQFIASYLAQDAIEYIMAHKNNQGSENWNTIFGINFNPNPNQKYYINTMYSLPDKGGILYNQTAGAPEDGILVICSGPGNTCPVNLTYTLFGPSSSGGYYGYSPAGVLSDFNRYVQFIKVSDEEWKIKVTVEYRFGRTGRDSLSIYTNLYKYDQF